MPGQVSVTRKDIPWHWTAKDIVDEISVASVKPGPPRIVMSQVELDARCAIEKQAPGLTIRQHQCERD